MKKVIAIMLTVTLLACSASMFGSFASAQPSGAPVSTIEDFIAMTPNGKYYLANDIDFSGGVYNKNLYGKEFVGVLDGNGHALTGITIEGSNSDAGIFANWFAGTLKNIVIGSEDKPIEVSSTGGGYSVAAIAGTMRGGAVIDGVTVYANVRGDGKTSGISSYIQSGNVTVKNTAVYGAIKGNPAAGFFALSNDSSSNVTITDSYNYASVTANNSSAGGFYTVVANVNGGRSGSLKITGSVNFGAITATDWRCGGIVGEYHENLSSTMTIDYCYNMGTITMKGGGGFACGIVGGASFDSPSGKRTITNVYNAGEVKNTVNAANAYAIAFSNHNTANVTVERAAYTSGNATLNVAASNVTKAETAAALTSVVTAYPASSTGNRFVEDTLGYNNGYPILAREVQTHENVKDYACGRKVCLDCNRILSKASEEKHTYTDNEVQPNGYLDGLITSTCSACGDTLVKAGKPSTHRPEQKNGVFQIATADHLKWYQANLSEGRLNGRESLVLTADIDMKNALFTPIGSVERPFGGKFDGAQHTISNFRVENVDNGGLFGRLTMGAAISMLEINDAVIVAKDTAGALFGSVSAGSTVKIEWIAVSNINAKTLNGSAGAIGGSTASATEVVMNQCAVSASDIGGKYVGAILGNGNATTMSNCYASAKAAGTGYDGTLAYHTNGLRVNNCGFVRWNETKRTDGTEISMEDFEAGAAAHLINAYANKTVFGCENGVIGFGDPVHMVFMGEKRAYTTELLSDTGDLEVYTDGYMVAIAVKRGAGPRLTDTPIKLTANGKTVEVKVSEMTLTRRVTLDNKLYTVASESALYVFTLQNVTAYTAGEISGNAVTK